MAPDPFSCHCACLALVPDTSAPQLITHAESSPTYHPEVQTALSNSIPSCHLFHTSEASPQPRARSISSRKLEMSNCKAILNISLSMTGVKCQIVRPSPRYLTGLDAYPLPSGLHLAYSQLGTVVELHATRLLRPSISECWDRELRNPSGERSPCSSNGSYFISRRALVHFNYVPRLGISLLQTMNVRSGSDISGGWSPSHNPNPDQIRSLMQDDENSDVKAKFKRSDKVRYP